MQIIGDQPAEHRADDRRHHEHRRGVALVARPLHRRGDLGDDRLRERNTSRAAEALQHAADDQRHHVRRHGRDQRAGQDEADRDQHHRAPAVDVGQLAVERRRHGRGEQIGRHHPGDIVEIVEADGDRRQRRRDDGAVERAEEHRQQDREHDRAHGRVVERPVGGGSLLGDSAVMEIRKQSPLIGRSRGNYNPGKRSGGLHGAQEGADHAVEFAGVALQAQRQRPRLGRDCRRAGSRFAGTRVVVDALARRSRRDRGFGGDIGNHLRLALHRVRHRGRHRRHVVDGVAHFGHRRVGTPGGRLNIGDVARDRLGRLRGLGHERLDLARHHGEAASRLPRARRLDGGVEREQIGLCGDRLDQRDGALDAAGRRGEGRDRSTVSEACSIACRPTFTECPLWSAIWPIEAWISSVAEAEDAIASLACCARRVADASTPRPTARRR